jgi:formimidoylglutamate deiminase
MLRSEQGEGVRIGCALHSLRAVPEAAMRDVLAALPTDSRIHIHIAEQQPEVDECIALRGARPVQWLLDHADVTEQWTLVHATHLDDAEVQRIARSGATVAICTTTEANLGDGFFPLRDYLDAGGRWGIGSDSNSSISPVEELRWLEYGQRLRTQRRNIAVSTNQPSVGETLLRGVVASATDSTGFDAADRIVLDAEAPILAGATRDDVVDRWLFSGNRNLVREVEVAGVRVVEGGRHRDRDAVAACYRDAMKRLLG